MISVPLFLTEPHECSYLDDRAAQTVFVHPSYPVNTPVYSLLIEKGFRRSGDDVYATKCPSCTACLSARIPVSRFKPDRRQRRCWRKNHETHTIIKNAQFDPRHFDLYLKYQNFKHPGGSMAEVDEAEYKRFLSSSWCDTRFVEFWRQDQLMAVAVVDFLGDALSAVYTFFEPDLAHFSPGTYGVLWQIDYAKKHAMDYVYLGYWIKQCPKMSYKSQYKPLEILIGQHWRMAGE